MDYKGNDFSIVYGGAWIYYPIEMLKRVHLSFSGLVGYGGVCYMRSDNQELVGKGMPVIDADLFADVNVIPMDSERILPRQTVIIENGLIREIQDADKTIIPEHAKIIHAEGQYLIPGLIDMHVHIPDDNDLFALLSHGVTTVRNMADVPGWVKFFMGFLMFFH